MKKLNVLAIGAHPDDIEFSCGGTMAKYAKLGHKAFMCHLSDGAKGGLPGWSDEETTRIRAAEAKAAARLIGAEWISLGLPDTEMEDTIENRKLVIDLIRSTKPDVIITHYPDDYSPDHIVTYKLVHGATFFVGIDSVKTRHESHKIKVPIYFMDVMAGMGFNPELFVDITDEFETKMEMIKKHKSAITWMDDYHTPDPLEVYETIAKYRGYQAGVRYAEGFKQMMLWPRVTAERLLP
jgi:LmbE family N-acetylglucosaminyl deacetylase